MMAEELPEEKIEASIHTIEDYIKTRFSR